MLTTLTEHENSLSSTENTYPCVVNNMWWAESTHSLFDDLFHANILRQRREGLQTSQGKCGPHPLIYQTQQSRVARLGTSGIEMRMELSDSVSCSRSLEARNREMTSVTSSTDKAAANRATRYVRKNTIG